MPFIKETSFKPSLLLRNRHVNTLYRFLFSKIKVEFKRKRMVTNDNDFIDLDFSKVNADRIVIAIHGLEGSSASNYINTITQTLNQANYDVVVFNMRGCSGEPNRLLSSYHSGKTEDLLEIITYLEKNYNYKQIHIVGYSLGGNLTLKFMGEFAKNMPELIKSAVGVSVPCNLKGSVESISKSENKIYMKGFLKTLKEKAIYKATNFPKAGLNIEKIKKASTFYDFDNLVTAPIHGFVDAEDYWKKSSCKQFIKDIKHPTLLISAKDDPFLNENCFPIKEAKESTKFIFIQTLYGGHLGFVESFNLNKQRWVENQVLHFIKENS
jgi:predicted alpha/beta-fold hydrolase